MFNLILCKGSWKQAPHGKIFFPHDVTRMFWTVCAMTSWRLGTSEDVAVFSLGNQTLPSWAFIAQTWRMSCFSRISSSLRNQRRWTASRSWWTTWNALIFVDPTYFVETAGSWMAVLLVKQDTLVLSPGMEVPVETSVVDAKIMTMTIYVRWL